MLLTHLILPGLKPSTARNICSQTCVYDLGSFKHVCASPVKLLETSAWHSKCGGRHLARRKYLFYYFNNELHNC